MVQFVLLMETGLMRLLIHEHDRETRLTFISGMAEHRTCPSHCRGIVLSIRSF